MIGFVRKIVLYLVGAFTIAAHADICEFCTYEVTAENIEKFITEDKLKDTTAVFEILDKYINWQAGTREDLIALMSQEVRDTRNLREPSTTLSPSTQPSPKRKGPRFGPTR